jgi:hypothetical protein
MRNLFERVQALLGKATNPLENRGEERKHVRQHMWYDAVATLELLRHARGGDQDIHMLIDRLPDTFNYIVVNSVIYDRKGIVHQSIPEGETHWNEVQIAQYLRLI